MAIKDDAWASLLGREPQQDEVVEVWALDFSRKKPVFKTKVKLRQGITGRWRSNFVQAIYPDDIFATKEEAQRALMKGLLYIELYAVQDDARHVDKFIVSLHKELARTYRDVIKKRALLVEHGATKAQITAFEKHVEKLTTFERTVQQGLTVSVPRALRQLADEALYPWKSAPTKAPKRSGRASKRA